MNGRSLERPLITLSSTAKERAVLQNVLELNPGTGLVATRGDVPWVVTEFGTIDLHGRMLRERGDASCSPAHPDFSMQY